MRQIIKIIHKGVKKIHHLAKSKNVFLYTICNVIFSSYLDPDILAKVKLDCKILTVLIPMFMVREYLSRKLETINSNKSILKDFCECLQTL